MKRSVQRNRSSQKGQKRTVSRARGRDRASAGTSPHGHAGCGSRPARACGGHWILGLDDAQREPGASPARRCHRRHAVAGGGDEAGRQAALTGYPTVQARAEAALAKFAEVYNAYPSTDAGIASRYYAASTLALLGRVTDRRAAARFQETADRAGANSFYGRMARLVSSKPTPSQKNTTRPSPWRRRLSTTPATIRFRATRC